MEPSEQPPGLGGDGLSLGGSAATAATATATSNGHSGAAPGAHGGVGAPTATNVRAPEGEDLDGEGGRMTLFEHLAELRRRVLICAAAVILTSIAGYFLYNPVLHFMTAPYRAFYHHHKHLISPNLVISSPAEGFTTRIKVAMYIGIALAAPVWLWQIWRFITPGLKKREKQYAVPFVVSACALFAMGVTVAVLVWPKALDWLISASGSGVAPLFTPSGYVSLYTLICLVFGVVFLYPTVVVFLMVAGVIPSAKWRKWRRPAIVVLCVVAAVATPSNDPFSFLGMAVPMVIFYEGSILVGRLLGK
jgi:sec-independent protein translocase protein TatC